MTRKESIEHKLRALNPHFLEVDDVSARHIGHSGNPNGDGQTHFEIKISSHTLKSYTKIEQHRVINNLLKEEFVNGLHALSITIVPNK
jgi:stress-induced morphogen